MNIKDTSKLRASKLARQYNGKGVTLMLNSLLRNHEEIQRYFDRYGITYELYKDNDYNWQSAEYYDEHGEYDGFDLLVGFVSYRELYILATILKNFGLKDICFSSKALSNSCSDKILIGGSEDFYEGNRKNWKARSADEVLNRWGFQESDAYDDYLNDFLQSASRRKIKSNHDPYGNFYFGGLSGEEAHTAYWNCD